jgi:nucleoside-diphosphate-sugar epimerase
VTTAPETWLLMGTSGRVGRLLEAVWRQNAPVGVRLLAQSRRRSERAGADALTWAPIEDGAAPLAAWVKANGPISSMLMFAGVTPAPGADPAVNVALTEAALAAAAAAGIGKVLLASSSAVYEPGQALCETAPTRPVSAYGQAKLDAEARAAIWRARGLQVSTLRIGNVAGADALLCTAAKARSGGEPLRLDSFADGTGPMRSYIGPATLAEVLETLARQFAPPQVLNVASPDPVTMQALAEAAALPFVFAPAPASARQSVTLDCTALAALHRFRPADSDPAEMVAQLRRIGAQP